MLAASAPTRAAFPVSTYSQTIASTEKSGLDASSAQQGTVLGDLRDRDNQDAGDRQLDEGIYHYSQRLTRPL